MVLEVSKIDDEGLHLSLATYLSLSDGLKSAPSLLITLSLRHTSDEKSEQIGLSIGGVPYEVLRNLCTGMQFNWRVRGFGEFIGFGDDRVALCAG